MSDDQVGKLVGSNTLSDGKGLVYIEHADGSVWCYEIEADEWLVAKAEIMNCGVSPLVEIVPLEVVEAKPYRVS
jgi:hypothetical protein